MKLSRSQNWLLITFDQWRGDWLNQPWLRLPNLQKLGRQGWHIQRCYTSCPTCIPARVSWLTGKSPVELGLTTNRPYSISPDAASFVRELHDLKGYQTAVVGKTHWTPHGKSADLRDNLPLLKSLGFDHAREIAGPRALRHLNCELTDLWKKEGVFQSYCDDLSWRYEDGCKHRVRPTCLPDDLYPDIWLTGVAIEELDRMPKDKPWFLWVSFVGPHEPFDVPESWSRSRKIAPPAPRPDDLNFLKEIAPEGSVLHSRFKQWPNGLPPHSVNLLRQDYSNHLELLDHQVGILMESLSSRSDSDNTAVTVCSDHGELLGDWGLLLKSCFLEGAIRSLFIHRPPSGRKYLSRLFGSITRPFGLTETLWAAKDSVGWPEHANFESRLRNMNHRVTVAYADEVKVIE